MIEEPRPAQDDWDTHWERYAESAVRNPAQHMRHDLVAELLLESAPKEGARIFDLGSGQGDLLQKLDPLLPSAELLGAEMSAKGVMISRQKVPRAAFLVADIFRPPPELNSYLGWATHAVCCEVLEHVDDPVLFLEAARKYLAPGAQLIVTVPGGPMSAFDRHIGHRQHFNRAEVDSILTRAGYSTAEVYETGFPFFNLYRLLVIASGNRLVRDVETGTRPVASGLAGRLMQFFNTLFRANLRQSRFGWQLVAVAHNTAA